jgi:hypothetical protein
MCICGRAKRTTQCTDCFQSATSCNQCFITSHNNAPFHWAETWNGSFFERKDISKLDHTITLGHNGNQCPNAEYHESDSSKFIIVDTNGIHSTCLCFCKCAGKVTSEYYKLDQLLEAGLFPASVKQPSLTFTFNVLKDFHLHTLESKKSAYDFISALCQWTNNAFPMDVPVCF